MGLDREIVYIVDDDPIVRDALSSLLRSSGKTVRLFTSGTEFLSFNRDVDAPRAGSAAASGEGIVEQTGRCGVRNFRVHGSNSPRQHHAQDES
jgi:hypothetical protein